MIRTGKFRGLGPLNFFNTAAAVTGTTPVTAAAAAVERAANDKGIGPALLRAMLHTRGVVDLDLVLDFCFDRDAAAPSRRNMARLVDHLEGMELGSFADVDLASVGHKALRRWRDIFSGTVFVFCAWLVIGGVLTGQNAMALHTSSVFALAALGVCLITLALLEAAHIAAVALSTADVSELRESHPRVFKLHQYIATKPRLEHYLAGRQTGVVLVVFVIAEVTRTAGMSTLPGLGTPIPGAAEFLLTIGVPGALMVLCIGQVAPQLVAARTPAAMMNTAPMALAFTATRWIGNLGLALPAHWLVSGFKGHERIASAPRERFISETMDVTGFGTETQLHQVTVGSEKSESTDLTTRTFTQSGQTKHVAMVAVTTASPRATSSVTRLGRFGDLLPVVVTETENSRSATSLGHVFTEAYSPRIGSFEVGDSLQTEFSAVYDGQLTSGQVVVSAPVRLVVLRVVLEHPSAPLPPALLTIAHATNADVEETTPIAPKMSELDHSVEFVAIVRYPAVGSVITLDWAQEA